MSKIKLIVEIDEETYNDIQSRDWKNGELVFSEEWKAIHNGIPLDNLRAEISEYKDDKIIHLERNEMIDIVLGIIDKYMERSEE